MKFNTLTYKSFTAAIEFDSRDDIFVGDVIGIADSISFHASSVGELKQAFQEAIDDYLELKLEPGAVLTK